MFALLFMTLGMVSCSESDDTVEEFPDWQKTNEAYFNSIYNSALQRAESGDKSWKVLKNYSMPNASDLYKPTPEEHVVVNVLKEGNGAGSPLFTDSVYCHYKGRLLPSTSYAEGYVFDQSWYGTFNESTAIPSRFVVSGLVDGFSTALQNMHVGDEWRVYIPHQLGYGEKGSTSIPGYSTLVFDITLVKYHRPGAGVPAYQ